MLDVCDSLFYFPHLGEKKIVFAFSSITVLKIVIPVKC